MRNLSKLIAILILTTIASLPLYNIVRIHLWGGSVTVVDILVALTVLAWLAKRLISPRAAHSADQARPFTVEKRHHDAPIKAERRKEWLIPGLRFRRFRAIENAGIYLWLIGLFVAAGVVAIWLSPTPLNAASDFRAFILEPVLFGIILFAELGAQQEVRFRAPALLTSSRVVLTLLASGVAVAVYGIYQAVTLSNPIAPLEASQGRITSVFNNPNFLALYAAPVVLVSLFFLGQFKQKSKSYINLQSVILVSGLALIFASIVLTKSAGGLSGLAIALIVGLFHLGFRYRSYYKAWVMLFLGSFLAIYIAGFVYLFVTISYYTPNYHNIYPRPDSSTLTIRLCLWEGTINVLHDHFWVGLGLSGFKTLYPLYQTCDTEHLPYPHNIVLNFWVEVGLVGLISFMSLLFLLVFDLLLAGKLETIGLATALIYWFSHGQVDVPYFKNDLSMLFWIIVFLSLYQLAERASVRDQDKRTP